METLKRVLTVMVVTLVLIIIVGGIYTFSMGNMDHGTGGQAVTTTAQNKTEGEVKVEPVSPDQKSQEPSKDSKDSPNNQTPVPTAIPVIIQPPPEPKTDPRLYVEQLKEKIKLINDANAQIAANTGGQAMVVQPNGSAATSSQSNMNALHEGFYKLGQNVSSMEQAIDSLAKSMQGANAGTPYYYGTPQYSQYPAQPQVTYYPYSYPQNYPQYNPNLPYANHQMPQPAQPANQMNSSNPNTQMDPNMQMSSNTPMNHSSFSLSGLLSANNIKLVFSLILLGSVILGIVAVVGFVGSLFKSKKVTQDNVQI